MNSNEIITFGCRLNAFESEIIRRAARQPGSRAAIIVNTCAVTAEAERQARQAISRARRESPRGARLSSPVAPPNSRPSAMPKCRKSTACSTTARNCGRKATARQRRRRRIFEETATHLIDGFDGRARAFLQVQQGCDHRCTFCIIPYARGCEPLGADWRHRRPSAAAGRHRVPRDRADRRRSDRLRRRSPGRAEPRTNGAAAARAVPALVRLRLSSLDPAEIDGELWRLIAEEPRLMPHLHLSLQAGDDLILKRMKRRHSRADAIAATQRARALAAGGGTRGRSDRGVSDRDRRDVPPQPRSHRRMRPRLCTCISLQPAPGDAGSAHAPGPHCDDKGTSGAVAAGRGSGTRG